MSILLGILVGLALPVQTSVNNKLRDKVGTPYNSSLVSFIISTVFLGCLLLVLAALLAARRLRLRRRLAEIAAAEDKAAIALRFAYAAWLMGYAGATAETLAAAGLDYAAARRMQLEALYSQHTMDPAQRQWMDDYAAQVLAHCQNRWKRLQRWYYHWIKCLY